MPEYVKCKVMSLVNQYFVIFLNGQILSVILTNILALEIDEMAEPVP